MGVGKIIKRTIQLAAGLGLCAMFGFPLANAWFEAHPDQVATLEDAAGQVDPEAGTIAKAGQFVGAIPKSRQVVAEKKRDEADDKAFDEAQRKADEMRRFNAGYLGSE